MLHCEPGVLLLEQTMTRARVEEQKISTLSETRSQESMKVPPRRSARKNVQKPHRYRL